MLHADDEAQLGGLESTASRIRRILGRTPDGSNELISSTSIYQIHSTEVLAIGDHLYHRLSPFLDLAASNNRTFPTVPHARHCTVTIRDPLRVQCEETSAILCDLESCRVCAGENSLDLAKADSEEMECSLAQLLIMDGTQTAYNGTELGQALRETRD